MAVLCGVAVRLRCAGSDGGNPIRTVHNASAAGACLKFSRGGRGRRGARWGRMECWLEIGGIGECLKGPGLRLRTLATGHGLPA